MDKKVKFIIIGLSLTVIIFILFILSLTSVNQSLKQQNQELQEENQSLTKQNDALGAELKRQQEKNSILQKEMEKIQKEKEALQHIAEKYNITVKEKESLVARIRELEDKIKYSAAISTPQVQPAQKIQETSTDTYWAGLLKSNTDLQLQIKNLQEELRNIKINNTELENQKKNLELQISSLARDNEELKHQLEYNQKITDSLAQEIIREKNDKIKIQEFLKTVKAENESLRRQLSNFNNQKIVLERKITELQTQNNSLNEKIRQMDALLQERALQMDNLRQQLERTVVAGTSSSKETSSSVIELSPIVVKASAEPTVSSSGDLTVSATETEKKTGKILAVNRAYNFVVVDLGEAENIKIGDVFEVYQDNKRVGKIQVTQIRKDICACDIINEISPFKVGDKVVR